MPLYWSSFWVSGQPETITRLLGLAPTAVRRAQPFDYWDYGIESSDVEVVFRETFQLLRNIRSRLSTLPPGCAYGLVLGATIDDDGRNTIHHLEPHEMRELAEMNVPVAFQTIVERSR
jgi:hypothetical protein